jgi:hypothetical protein
MKILAMLLALTVPQLSWADDATIEKNKKENAKNAPKQTPKPAEKSVEDQKKENAKNAPKPPRNAGGGPKPPPAPPPAPPPTT